MHTMTRILLVVALLVLSACNATTAKINKVVWNVGDSIIAGTANTIIQSELTSSKGLLPIYQAHGGFSLVRPEHKIYWRERLAEIQRIDLRADVVVVSLGTNDAGYLKDNPSLNAYDEFEDAMREFMEGIPAGTRVLWIPQTEASAIATDRGAQWLQIIAAMISVGEDYANLEFLDYETFVNGKGFTIAEVTTDSVHPNAKGAELLAEMIVGGI